MKGETLHKAEGRGETWLDPSSSEKDLNNLIDHNLMGTSHGRDFIFLGSKITADGDRSHEIKRRFLLGR